MAGRMLVDLIEQSSRKIAKAIASQQSFRKNAQIQTLEQVLQESIALRKTLLSVRLHPYA
jgi:hypothetical protein